ncbi:Ribonuclease P protein subunit p30 [Carex littledalei]|uniref:Ribonuclease P protein subunit p30 n=1 Tax=Carex littledalei TaxID=544730 RepID=A0A833QZR4_9POAL|nr:Ribonuclease P protein subunit p30 [Carex littledalei]
MSRFFDLNLPYTATAGGNRDTRLRSVVSLLELGYSGAAYNLSLRGVISDRDRCAIAPFPLSSLLAAAPSLAASASFHRRLLVSGNGYGDPAFRQFSRVTVSVDTVAGAGSVGSTSAVLRGYDVVAVRPVSQSAFEHVCKFSEVDLISIDFSHKVPFRLRHQSVKLAIKRGIFFEITYSHLLSDNASIKKQALSDAKMLADLTRGKNLIVSSGASNANEVRGPNDVSNLISFLLGVSKERAKAAISDNCRSLLAKALRKKHFYKETIRIERMPTNQSDSEPFSVGDWIKWDPLSSGEGDLPSLEEISKVDPNPSNRDKIKAIDFDSIVQEKPFLLSQHADKLHRIEQVSGDREETEADDMQLDDQQHTQLEACYLKNDNIAIVPSGSNHSDGTLHNNMEAPLKECSFEKDNSSPVPNEMQIDDQEALLKECDLQNDDITLAPCFSNQSDGTLPNKMRATLKECSFEKDNSDQALLKECGLKDDDITLVPGGPNQSDGILHNKMEALLKECISGKDNSVPVSNGYQEEICTEPRWDIEVPLSNNSTVVEDRFVGELNTPLIQNEFRKDHNAPEGVVGICDKAMAVAGISNEATTEENTSSLSNLIDKVYAEKKKIDQMKDENDVEGENKNNRDAIVEMKGVVGNNLEINLIGDEDKKIEKIENNTDVEEEQERGFKIIKLDDTRETVDATTSTSSSISLMEAVLHDLGGKQDWEISNFTQQPCYNSSTKGKRKQKGPPLHQPYTMSFKDAKFASLLYSI